MVKAFRYIACIVFLTMNSSITCLGQSIWHGAYVGGVLARAKGETSKPIRVLQIGDSHLSGGHTSRPIRDSLSHRYGSQVNFAHHGISGSTYSTWMQEKNLDLIQREKPDLLIVSLGTNDSYTKRFSPETLRSTAQALIVKVKQMLPEVRIVLTTPPACYFKERQSHIVGYRKKCRRRVPTYAYTTSYRYNTNTKSAVNTIKYVARAEGMSVIDLNHIIGTREQAEAWLSKGWMHPDHVHYTETGYTKQGEALAQALLEGLSKE